VPSATFGLTGHELRVRYPALPLSHLAELAKRLLSGSWQVVEVLGQGVVVEADRKDRLPARPGSPSALVVCR
jgi:hypothetical protein